MPRPLNKSAQALRSIALKLPDTAEGIACAGTAVESLTITIRGKAFLFIRSEDARFKLKDSLPAATKFAAAHPDILTAGIGGWMKLIHSLKGAPPRATLAKWIAESYSLVNPPRPTRTAPRSASGHPPAPRRR